MGFAQAPDKSSGRSAPALTQRFKQLLRDGTDPQGKPTLTAAKKLERLGRSDRTELWREESIMKRKA
jgi:hypothetical protein